VNEPPLRPIPVFPALALVAVTFAALATFGAVWSTAGLGGTVAAETACVLLPTVFWLWLARVPAATLGASAPSSLRGWLGIGVGFLAGAGAFYLLAAVAESWLERIWPTPPALREALERLVIPAGGRRPLAVDLLALALLPAVAEELLFRGVLWGALRPRLGVAGTLVATALVFGLYHGSPYRFLPAVAGGLLLGGVRAASGSVWPAIAFHVANNGGVIVALRLGYEHPPATAGPLGLALAALAIGAALVPRFRA
jgi:membrane protease YdiL (CAAX protease family)